MDYESKVRNHNVMHGLDNKPLQVPFMLKKKLAKALLEECPQPNVKYNSACSIQQQLIRDFYFQTPGTIHTAVDTYIKIKDLGRGIRHMQMNERDTSWVSRVVTYLSKIKVLKEDTRVAIADKEVNPVDDAQSNTAFIITSDDWSDEFKHKRRKESTQIYGGTEATPTQITMFRQ